MFGVFRDDRSQSSTSTPTKARTFGRKNSKGSSPSQPAAMQQPIDPYQVLALRRDATLLEIQSAYRSLALLHHPHRTSTGGGAAADSSGECATQMLQQAKKERQKRKEWRFAVLAASYETLSVEAYRRRYDHSIKVMAQQKRQPTVGSPTAEGCAFQFPAKQHFFHTTTRVNDEDGPGWDVGFPSSGKNGCPTSTNPRNKSQTPSTTTHDSNASCNKGSCSGDSGNNIIFQCKPLEHFYDDDSDGEEHRQESRPCNLDDEEEETWVGQPTNNHFGGPLALLYRARNYEPFTDPYTLFTMLFGGADIFRCSASSTNSSKDEDDPMKRVQRKLRRMGLDHKRSTKSPNILLPSPGGAGTTLTAMTSSAGADIASCLSSEMTAELSERYGLKDRLIQMTTKDNSNDNGNSNDASFQSRKGGNNTNSCFSEPKPDQSASGYHPILPSSTSLNINSSVIPPPKGSHHSSKLAYPISYTAPTSILVGTTVTTTQENITETKRVVNGSLITRTETTMFDLTTGKKKTVIEVTREDIPDDDAPKNTDEDNSNSHRHRYKKVILRCGYSSHHDEEGLHLNAGRMCCIAPAALPLPLIEVPSSCKSQEPILSPCKERGSFMSRFNDNIGMFSLFPDNKKKELERGQEKKNSKSMFASCGAFFP